MCSKHTRLLLFLMLPVLSACAHGSTALTATSDYCRIAQPMAYDSKADSAPTVATIEAHNSAWVCVCEHDCPEVPH